MIKNIRFFINDNEESIKYSKIVKEDFYKNGFNIVENKKFDLGIAIGGDGSFLRMIKKSKYDCNPYYIGINTGHLGFFQEVNVNEHNELIDEILNGKYKVVETILQKSIVKTNDKESLYHTLNEIRIEDLNRKLLQADIYVNGDLLENFAGDGLIISTSSGSTAHNLSYNGSIVDPDVDILQLTPLGPLDNKRFRSLRPSIIFKAEKTIELKPKNKNVKIFTDGNAHTYKDIVSISSVGNEKIKCLKLSHYSFTNKTYSKMINY